MKQPDLPKFTFFDESFTLNEIEELEKNYLVFDYGYTVKLLLTS